MTGEFAATHATRGSHRRSHRGVGGNTLPAALYLVRESEGMYEHDLLSVRVTTGAVHVSAGGVCISRNSRTAVKAVKTAYRCDERDKARGPIAKRSLPSSLPSIPAPVRGWVKTTVTATMTATTT